MNLTLNIWRQKDSASPGQFARYEMRDVDPDLSFLEMLDLLNEQILEAGQEPIAFDSDCREGICGSCGLMINGEPHGPQYSTATCQLHMRSFHDGDEIWIEPWRAKAFPIVRDLIVDRSALDRIIIAGGYISVRTGSAPEANILPIRKAEADNALDAAACIGCGACVAVCPNASAMLFTSAKVSHLAMLPQGHPERWTRVRTMVRQHDAEGFGNCTNHGECQFACPVNITVDTIAWLNRDLLRAELIPPRETP